MIISKELRESAFWDEVKAIIKTLDGNSVAEQASPEALQHLVRQVKGIITCDHVFLTIYDNENKIFRAVAWDSSFEPQDIAREQKFMWDKYCLREPVIISNLASYNHRLRPSAVRIQMLSMAGVPIANGKNIAGVLEVYSHEEAMFSDADIAILNLYAKQAAAILQQMEQEQELRYVAAENSLLKLLISSEKLPEYELLANLGMLFKSALPVEGIAVLAVEGEADRPVLSPVMADGIPQASISKFVSTFTGSFLNRLVNLPEGVKERYLVTSSSAGTGNARAAYIIPIVWRSRLHGLIVFYCKDLEGRSPERLLRFIKQITEHIGTVFDRKYAYSHMQRISLTDALTGLSNRRLFDYALAREFKRVKRTGQPLSLLLIDIDYFKKINDTYGHTTGDLVLSELGAQLTTSFRGTDIAARYGGEEFAVILPDTDRNDAMMIAERLREDVAARKFASGSVDLSITVSIGIATYDAKGEAKFTNVESLIEAADQALYRAKQLGRNLTIVWSGT